MNIPSIKECFKLIKNIGMMDHIVDHSIVVSNIAFFICINLKKQFPDLNTRLVTSAALLHDITKTRSFDTKEIHSETGGLMLTSLGYPEVGNIIRQHVVLDFYGNDSPVSEQEIVNYSDKRVLHDKVVPLKKRLEYIKLRYGARKEFKDHIQIMWANTLDLENKIFYHLDITPGQLSECITQEIKRESY
ncbi:MAG: HDIG domain-containing protein [Desulfobacterales bacterium]|nr:HDIG domain-containing protein [Desulfobacterales bacterium]